MIQYILRPSRGKKVKISIDKQLNVIVTAPRYVKQKEIDKIVIANEEWIKEAISKTKNALSKSKTFTEEEKAKLRALAKNYVPFRVKELAKGFGVLPSDIKITSARTRWGSCSSTNSLNFSYYIMLLEPDIIDYIIIHELSHILVKNHSSEFYKVVEGAMPDFKDKISRLKKFEKENIIL